MMCISLKCANSGTAQNFVYNEIGIFSKHCKFSLCVVSTVTPLESILQSHLSTENITVGTKL